MTDETLNINGRVSWTIEVPTGQLRFVKGRLQQEWAIQTEERQTKEWRDVPEAQP